MTAPFLLREQAEALLAQCELHKTLGLVLIEWQPGKVLFRFAPPALARTPTTRAVHGGAIITALDTAASFGVISQSGLDCSTVDIRTDFLRPATDDEFIVRGEAVRVGRRFGWGEATLATAQGLLLAKAIGTFTSLT